VVFRVTGGAGGFAIGGGALTLGRDEVGSDEVGRAGKSSLLSETF
jgi:hypothetical protein